MNHSCWSLFDIDIFFHHLTGAVPLYMQIFVGAFVEHEEVAVRLTRKEDGDQKTEVPPSHKALADRRRTEDGGQRTEVGDQKSEDGELWKSAFIRANLRILRRQGFQPLPPYNTVSSFAERHGSRIKLDGTVHLLAVVPFAIWLSYGKSI